MSLQQLNQDQKIAIALMNLPARETAELWSQLTVEEQAYYAGIYARLPRLEAATSGAVLEELLAA